MAYHKGRGILFGGVHDVEENEEGIESEFSMHFLHGILNATGTSSYRLDELELPPRGRSTTAALPNGAGEEQTRRSFCVIWRP